MPLRRLHLNVSAKQTMGTAMEQTTAREKFSSLQQLREQHKTLRMQRKQQRREERRKLEHIAPSQDHEVVSGPKRFM